MKKMIILAVVMLLATTTASFAAYGSGKITLGAGSSTLDVELSNKVSMDYKAESTAGLAYTVGAYHTSGTRTFASSSGDAKIYWFDGTAKAIPAAPSTGTAGATWTNWTAL